MRRSRVRSKPLPALPAVRRRPPLLRERLRGAGEVARAAWSAPTPPSYRVRRGWIWVLGAGATGASPVSLYRLQILPPRLPPIITPPAAPRGRVASRWSPSC